MTTTKKKSTNKKIDDSLKSSYDKLKETDPVLWQICENIRTIPPISYHFRAVDFSSGNNNNTKGND